MRLIDYSKKDPEILKQGTSQLRRQRRFNPDSSYEETLLCFIKIKRNCQQGGSVFSSEKVMTSIRELIEKVEINYQDGDGDTFLHAALKVGDLEVASLILQELKERQQGVAILNNEGKTPYRLAEEMYSSISNWKDFLEDLKNSNMLDSNLIIETLYNGDYKWQLTAKDVGCIAKVGYLWDYESNFDVVGLDHLEIQLTKCANKLSKGEHSIFIVNQDNLHWVTLVVSYSNSKLFIYYVDSLGASSDRKLNTIIGNFKKGGTKGITDVDVRTFYPTQQTDYYNCGLYALKNAELVVNALKNEEAEQIGRILSDYKPSEDELQKERDRLVGKLKEAIVKGELENYVAKKQLLISPRPKLLNVMHEYEMYDSLPGIDDTYPVNQENKVLSYGKKVAILNEHFYGELLDAVDQSNLDCVQSLLENSKVEITADRKEELLNSAYSNICRKSSVCDVPGSGSCLFYAVAFAYLTLPEHRGDDKFSEACNKLFSKMEGMHASLQEVIDKPEEVQENWKFTENDLAESLIKQFRIDVINYIKGHQGDFEYRIKTSDLFNTRNKAYFSGGYFQESFRKEFRGKLEEEDISKLVFNPENQEERREALNVLEEISRDERFVKFRFAEYLKIMENPQSWAGEIEVEAISSMLESVINVWDNSNMKSFGLDKGYGSNIYLLGKDDHYKFYVTNRVIADKKIVKLLRDYKSMYEIVDNARKEFTKAFVEVFEMKLNIYSTLGAKAKGKGILRADIIDTKNIVQINFAFASIRGRIRDASPSRWGFLNLSGLVTYFLDYNLASRRTFIEAGLNIFQSFEALFMELGIDTFSILAGGIVDRIIDYYIQKEYRKDKDGATITDAFVLGKYMGDESRKMVNYEGKLHSVLSLFNNIGIVKEEENNLNFYYEKGKKDEITVYRRPFINEKLRSAYILHTDMENVNSKFANYKYILDRRNFMADLRRNVFIINKEVKIPSEKRIDDFIEKIRNHIQKEAKELEAKFLRFTRKRKMSLAQKAGQYVSREDIGKSDENRKKGEESLETIRSMLLNLKKIDSNYYVELKKNFLQRSHKILLSGKMSFDKSPPVPLIQRVLKRFRELNVSGSEQFTGGKEEISQIHRKLELYGASVILGDSNSRRKALARKYATECQDCAKVYEVTAQDMQCIQSAFADLVLEHLKITISEKVLIILHGAKLEDLEKLLSFRKRFGNVNALAISNDEELKGRVEVVKLDNHKFECYMSLAKNILSIEDELKDEEIKTLAEKLERSTLPIRLAAAYIKESEIEISEYLSKYESLSEEQSDKREQDKALSITLKISIEAIKKRVSENEALLIDVLAYLDPNRVYLPEFFEHESIKSSDNILQLLEQYHIVEQGRGGYEISELINKELSSKFSYLHKMKVLDFGITVMGSSVNDLTDETVLDSIVLLFQHAQGYDGVNIHKIDIFLNVLYMYNFFFQYQQAADFGKEVLNVEGMVGSRYEFPVLYQTGYALYKLGEYQSALEFLMEDLRQPSYFSTALASSIQLDLSDPTSALKTIKNLFSHSTVTSKIHEDEILCVANAAIQALAVKKKYQSALHILNIVSEILERDQVSLYQIDTKFSTTLVFLFAGMDGKKITGVKAQNRGFTREQLLKNLYDALAQLGKYQFINCDYKVINVSSKDEQTSLLQKELENLESILELCKGGASCGIWHFNELNVRYYIALLHLVFGEDKEKKVLQEFQGLQRDIDSEKLDNVLAFKTVYRVSELLEGEERSKYLKDETEKRKGFLSEKGYYDIMTYLEKLVLRGEIEFASDKQISSTEEGSFQKITGLAPKRKAPYLCSKSKKRKEKRSAGALCVDLRYKKDIKYYYQFPKLPLYSFLDETTSLVTKEIKNSNEEINNIPEKGMEVLKFFAQVYEKLPYSSDITDSALGESVYYFAGICRISLMKAMVPIIKDTGLKNILVNNPEKLLQEASFRLDYILRKVYEKFSKRFDYKQVLEELIDEINQEISSVLHETINHAALGANKSDLLSYVSQSMELAKILLSQKVDSGLQRVVAYNALISLGMLVNDHKNYIEINNQDHLDSLESRIRDSSLLSLACILHDLRNEIDISSSKLSNAMTIMKAYFHDDDIEDFVDEIKAYDEEVMTINSSQLFIDVDDITLCVEVEDSDGSSKKLEIGSVANILDIESYDYDNLNIILEVGDAKEYVITEEAKGQDVEYYLNVDGYKVRVSDIIENYATDAKKEEICKHLHSISSVKELLKEKRYIEDIGSVKMEDQDYSKIENEIKRFLLKKRVSENTFSTLGDLLSNFKIFTKYIDSKENDLEGILFDRNKFDSARLKGTKLGNLFLYASCWDLLNSAGDMAELRKHGNSIIKRAVIVNSFMDAMNDLRESLGVQYISSSDKVITKIPHYSTVGKIISHVPRDLRRSFVKIIDNPVVRSITFASITYQLECSLNEIIKGNHLPLNYYLTTSSGVKIASMSIRPISIGVSATMWNSGAGILKRLSTISKILGKLMPVVVITDIFVVPISITFIKLYGRAEYVKTIASEGPLSIGEKVELVFAPVIKFFTRDDIDGKYEDAIRIRGYLDGVKREAIGLLSNNNNLVAVVMYVEFIEEYNLIRKRGDTWCRQLRNVSFGGYYGTSMKDLSSLNISRALSMIPYEIDGKKVYLIDAKAKHIPYLTEDEYEKLGVRIVDAPLSFQKSKSEYDEVIACSSGKIHTTYKKTFTFSGWPFVFTNSTRKHSSGAVLYFSGPKKLTAAKDYPAIMYVPKDGYVNYIGSENNITSFIINNLTGSELVGRIGRENEVVMNVKDKYITVNLEAGTIYNCTLQSNDTIRLSNIYNYISNFGNVTTHCKTKLIDVKNGVVSQGSKTCQDQDYEIRVVNEGNVHYRGLKKTIFIISESSNNAKIVSDMSSEGKTKDVIYINNADVKQLKISEEQEGYYSLNLLDKNTQSVISSIKVDSFKDLEIQVECLGVKGSVIVQKKFLLDIMKDMVYQIKHPIDIDENLRNSEKKLKAFIQINISSPELFAYSVAENVVNNNNLGIPIFQAEVIKNCAGVPVEKVIISGLYTDQIIVDYNSKVANEGGVGYKHSHYQSIMLGSSTIHGQYIIKLPEYNHTPRDGILKSNVFNLNLKIKNKGEHAFHDIIDLSGLGAVEVNDINIIRGKRSYFSQCHNSTISDLTDDSLEIKDITGLNDGGIKWSLSIGIVNYFKSSNYQLFKLLMNNKHYVINNEGLKLEDIEEESPIRPRSKRSIENNSFMIKDDQATSGASKPSSWINIFANSIVDAVKSIPRFIFSSFKPAVGIEHFHTSKAMTTQGVDVNGTLLLLDVFIRKITGQKYISTADQPTISLQEAECHASDIINGFEKVLKETAVKSGISVTNLNFDPIKLQSGIVGQLINGKFSEISKTLYSSAKQACPEFKQNKKFLSCLETRIEEFLDKKEFSSIGQECKEAKQIRKQELCSSANFITDNPKTYLNDPTIDKQLQGSYHTISS